jgi:metallo-beta-lactamase family protein
LRQVLPVSQNSEVHIYTINGFSAHADQAELLAWQKQTGARRTFRVHGEENSMNRFAKTLSIARWKCRLQSRSFEL